jgi:Anti-sigma-K factor rskA
MRRRGGEGPEDRANAELAALADGTLAADRRAALEARVAASPELADQLGEQRQAIALVRNASAAVEAPESLRARVEARRRADQRQPSARRLRLVIPATATAMAVAVVLFAVIGSGNSAEQFHAALGATALLPAAKGGATLTKTTSGWRIELDASGLPRLDSGRFYQAWLKNRAGVLIPIGTFNEGQDVTLWAGVAPKDFTTLTITRERADGNQASSGEKVLVGPVQAGSG